MKSRNLLKSLILASCCAIAVGGEVRTAEADAAAAFELTAAGTVLLERYTSPALPGGGHMVSAYVRSS